MSPTFKSLCSASCDDDNTWAMVCSWMAVSSLEDACAGTFDPAMEATGDNTGTYDSSVTWGPALNYDVSEKRQATRTHAIPTLLPRPWTPKQNLHSALTD